MPSTNHTVVLSINGGDYTSLLKRESLYVRHSIGNESGVCDFRIEDNGTYTPQGWDSVSVAIDGTVVFGGFIFQRNGEVIGAGSTKQTQWQVQCKDWSILLDQVIVEKQYTHEDDDAILVDLFSTYLPGEGFDVVSHTDEVLADMDISFDRITLREALNQMAARAGAEWYIEPDKKLTYQAFTGFSNSAFNIDTVSPNDSTTFDVAFGSLRRQVDESSIVNRVVVVGGDAKSAPKQTDSLAADGVSDTFGPLTQAPHSAWSVSYTLGGLQWVKYSTNIGYEPGEKLIAEDGDFEVTVNLETRAVRVRHRDGSVPDNATNVVVAYYYLTPITTTREHTGSQNYYGRTFTQHIYNQELTSLSAAQEYGDSILAKNAFGRETITFDVFEPGLQPGTRITINAPALGISTTVTAADLALEYDLTDGLVAAKDGLLWENGDDGVIENYLGTIRYVIQEVQYQPVPTTGGRYMMAAKVSIGDWQHTLVDALQALGASSSSSGTGSSLGRGSGQTPAVRSAGRLSNLASDLGEIAAGRSVFTDGGTARFAWDNYAGHTGAVVGLEDNGPLPYGAVYIMDGGTVRAKLGRMTGMESVGTITPTGWGLWTTNGYFQGVVAASQLIGGTVTGGQIIGGTVTGGRVVGGTVTGALVSGGTVSGALLTGGTLLANLGTVGGFTIEASKLWSSGGTIATGSIVNSSNPGVYMNSLGLFGFGTLGLTFKIPTNPAEAPWFSSGTINNVVYEVYESAIIRTSADVFSDGGVQIDNSGIFGVNPLTGAGALLVENGNILVTEDDRAINFAGVNFMLDATTGGLWAEQAYIAGTINAQAGQFSGTVNASVVTGGTISGARVSGGTVTGAVVSANSFTGNTFTGNTITGGTVTGAVVTANQISGGTITGALFNAADINSGTITGAVINGNTISGNSISGGTVTGSRITGGTITGVVVTANQISGGTVSGSLLSGGTISGGLVSGGTVSGALLTGGTLNGALIDILGGSLQMRSGRGITFYTDNDAIFAGGDSHLVWESSINGDQMGFLTAFASNGTPNAIEMVVATNYPFVDSSIDSAIRLFAGGTTSVASSSLYLHGGSVECRGNFVPRATSTTQSIGTTTHGWRYLYLDDSSGDTWRVAISGGSLVVTAA